MNPLRGRAPLLIIAVLSVTALSGCIDEFEAEVQEYDWHQWEDEWDSFARGMQGSYEEWREERERQKAEEAEAEDPSHHHHEDEDAHEHHRHTAEADDNDRDDDHAVDDYDDADRQYTNTIDGHEDSKKTISVPSSAGKLTVALAYDFDGHGEFVLRNPLGIRVASEDFNGQKEVEEDPWYESDDPMPGDWTLEIDLHGEGAYAVGFYH